MRIDVPHALDTADAIRRLDGRFDELVARSWPGGVVVSNVQKQWDGSRLAFAFAAGSGGFGVTIAGRLTVETGQVTLEAELPMMVRALVGEDRVRTAIAQGLHEVLAAPAP